MKKILSLKILKRIFALFLSFTFLISSFPVAEANCGNTHNSHDGGVIKGQEPQGEPVNLANGNYYHPSSDFTLPGRDLPIEISRTYNSQKKLWCAPLDICTTEMV